MNRANSALAAADVKLKQVFDDSDDFMKGIYTLFSAYEQKALTHSLTHSLTYLLTYLLTHSLTHSFIHSLTH